MLHHSFSPLAKALAKSHTETIQLLIEGKANPNTQVTNALRPQMAQLSTAGAQAQSGMTPLGTACRKSNLEAIKSLIGAGATVDANCALAAVNNSEVDAEQLKSPAHQL